MILISIIRFFINYIFIVYLFNVINLVILYIILVKLIYFDSQKNWNDL
jgi:hypothetical protein